MSGPSHRLPTQTQTPRTPAMKTSKTRRLQVENLENRELMAGNVSVSVQNGNLYITGDASRNHVEVRQSSPGVFRVNGVTIGVQRQKSTTPRTASSRPAPSAAMWLSRWGGGDDQLNFGTGDNRVINVPNNLTIDMGAGAPFPLDSRREDWGQPGHQHGHRRQGSDQRLQGRCRRSPGDQ